MMKQLIACFLAAVLLLLAGCAGNSSTRAVTAPGDKTIPALSAESGIPADSDPAASFTPPETDPAEPGFPLEPLSEESDISPETDPAEPGFPLESISEESDTSPETDPEEPGFPLNTEAPESDTPPQTDPAEPLNLDPWSFLGSLSYEGGQYTDKYGNEYDYSYDLPCIKGDTVGAMEINDAIDYELVDDVREARRDMKKKRSLGVTDIGFHGEVWEDILSVLAVERYYIDDHEDHFVYMYEVGTGRRLSTEALLERMGVTEEQFLSAAEEKMRETFIETYKEIPKKKRKQLGYYDALAILPDYANMDDVLAYPNADGEIMIIAPIPSLAGPAYFYETINLGLGAAD